MFLKGNTVFPKCKSLPIPKEKHFFVFASEYRCRCGLCTSYWKWYRYVDMDFVFRIGYVTDVHKIHFVLYGTYVEMDFVFWFDRRWNLIPSVTTCSCFVRDAQELHRHPFIYYLYEGHEIKNLSTFEAKTKRKNSNM